MLKQLPVPRAGTFFGPVLAEIPRADFLEREVFGPILHVVRYDLERPGAGGPRAGRPRAMA